MPRLLLFLLTALLLPASPALAATASGNPCAQLDASWSTLTVTAPQSGLYGSSAFWTELAVAPDGKSVDLTASSPISAVWVKGATQSRLYRFDPASTDASGLTAPPRTVGKDTKYDNISQLDVCYGPPPDDAASSDLPPDDAAPSDLPADDAPPIDLPTDDAPPGDTTGPESPPAKPGKANLSLRSGCLRSRLRVVLRGSGIRSALLTAGGRTLLRRNMPGGKRTLVLAASERRLHGRLLLRVHTLAGTVTFRLRHCARR